MGNTKKNNDVEDEKIVTGEELDKALQKVDRKIKVKKSLENERIVLEEKFRTNPEFSRYMEVIDLIKKTQEDIDALKPLLVTNMQVYEQSKFDGKNVIITLKKATQVRSVSIEDFVAMFDVNSTEYKKLVKVTNRKGSITIKEK